MQTIEVYLLEHPSLRLYKTMQQALKLNNTNNMWFLLNEFKLMANLFIFKTK